MDYSIVSAIVEFVSTVGVVLYVSTEKMPNKSTALAVVVHVVPIIAYHNVVYVFSYIWANEKLFVNVTDLKKIAMIVLPQHFVEYVPYVKKHVN